MSSIIATLSRKQLILVFMLLLGLVGQNLGHEVLWLDEGWSAWATNADSIGEVVDRVGDDVHPPLYFVDLYLWRKLAGDTVFALRYLSVLTTLLTIAVTYQLGQSMVNPLTGIIAAGLLIGHDLIHTLGREVRPYPQHQLLSLLTLWFFWRWWQRPNALTSAGLVASGTLLLWTNYWGGFILLALGLYALSQKQPTRLLHLIGLNALIILLFTPWLPVLRWQAFDHIPTGIGHALPARWDGGYDLLFRQLLGDPEVFWLCLIGVGMFVRVDRRAYIDKVGVLLAVLVIVPLGFSIAINTRYGILSYRTLSMVVPIALLLAARAIARFRVESDRWVVGLMAVMLMVTQNSALPLGRQNWPAFANYLAHHVGQDEIVVVNLYSDTYPFSYYLDQTTISYLPLGLERVDNLDPIFMNNYLTQNLSNLAGFWVVADLNDWPMFVGDTYDYASMIQSLGFVKTADIAWSPGFSFWHYDRIPTGEPRSVFNGELQLWRGDVGRRNDSLSVNLLWSPSIKPTWNYSISVFLLNMGGGLACSEGCQHDSYPLENRSPTQNWEAGGLYFDSHTLNITDVPAGQYQVGVKVYYFTDTNFTQLTIAPASDCSANAACEFILLEPVEIR